MKLGALPVSGALQIRSDAERYEDDGRSTKERKIATQVRRTPRARDVQLGVTLREIEDGNIAGRSAGLNAVAAVPTRYPLKLREHRLGGLE